MKEIKLKNRFGVSNLIFNKLQNQTLNSILNFSQVCDFAPTIHYGSWKNTPNVIPLKPYRNKLTKICALQSLFFNIDNISLLKSDKEFSNLFKHLIKVIKISAKSDIPYLIFGSPNTRKDRSSKLTDKNLFKRIESIANLAESYQTKLCFEVNSQRFGCEYINTNKSLLSLLSEMQHDGLGLHFDLGQMIDEKVDYLKVIKNNINSISHFHLSSEDFSFRPSMKAQYIEVIDILNTSYNQIDIILEVQSINKSQEPELVELCEELSIKCN